MLDGFAVHLLSTAARSPGQTGNPIETAVGVTGQGVYSYGNNTPVGSSIEEYLLREAERRDITVYVIPTTPEQDAAAAAAAVGRNANRHVYRQLREPIEQYAGRGQNPLSDGA